MRMSLCYEYDIEAKALKDVEYWCPYDVKIGQYKHVCGNVMWIMSKCSFDMDYVWK